METIKKQYPAIDLFKFLFACSIIFLHIDFGNIVVIDIIRCFSHLGVPFFFMASGFFLGKKMIDDKPIDCFIKRLLFLFLFWSVLYLPINIIPEVIDRKNSVLVVIEYFQRLLFLAPSYLWYLVALMIAVLIVYLFRKCNMKIQGAVFIILYIIGTLGNSYRSLFLIDNYTLYYDIFLTTRNGFFFAPIFVFIGVLVSKKEKNIKENFNKKINLNILIFIIILVLYIVETFYVKSFAASDDTSMYFTLPLVTYCIFKIIISIDIKNKTKEFLFLRSASLMIYCSQFGFIFVYSYILRRVLIINNLNLTIFSAMLVTFIIRKSKNKFFKKLI